MYLGPVTDTIPCYRDTYKPGLGTFTHQYGTQERTRHRYQCEACSEEFLILDLTAEPFYCDCQQLIGIERASKVNFDKTQNPPLEVSGKAYVRESHR